MSSVGGYTHTLRILVERTDGRMYKKQKNTERVVPGASYSITVRQAVYTVSQCKVLLVVLHKTVVLVVPLHGTGTAVVVVTSYTVPGALVYSRVKNTCRTL